MKNKHESSRAKRIAEDGLILKAEVGSTMHGTHTPESDRDEMGLCIEPPSCVIGLEEFEQYQYRTQNEGVRSGAGDVDGVIYSLRKWTRLAAAGNPTVILLLYVDEANVLQRVYPAGYALSSVRELLISRECGRRFLGYLQAQKEQMLGLRSKRTNRPELVDIYGYDTKFAYHAVRLGLQGIELINTRHITLPMEPDHREVLMQIRRGEWTKEQVLTEIEYLQSELAEQVRTCALPDKPDYAKVNQWLTDTYQEWWKLKGLVD